MSWSQTNGREQLVFKFDSRLPKTTPKLKDSKHILFPLSWSFWQRERKFRPPESLSSSALVEGLSTTQEGIIIAMRTDRFEFSFSTRPISRELVLDVWPFAVEPEQNIQTTPDDPVDITDPALVFDRNGTLASSLAGNASADENATGITTSRDAINATKPLPDDVTPDSASKGQWLTDPKSSNETEAKESFGPDQKQRPKFQEPDETVSGTTRLRSRITRPGQHPADQMNRTATEHSAPGFRMRMPIDRSTPAGTPLPPVNQGQSNAPEPTASNATDATSEALASNATAPLPEPVPAENDTAAPAQVILDMAQNATSNATVAPVPALLANTTSASISTGEVTVYADNRTEPDGNFTQTDLTRSNDNATAELERLYKKVQAALKSGDMLKGRLAATTMLKHPKASEEMREELLYILADISLEEGREDLSGNFTTILKALEAAKNANLQSEQLPEMLTRIGHLHLQVGNIPEAKGYFDLLRRRFPEDARVPMIDFYWGEHHLKKQNYSKAAEHFQYVIQNHPFSQAAVRSYGGLLKALTGLGFFEKALELAGKIEKRWPGFHLDDPSFLMTAGYAAMMSGNLEQAKNYFWTYVNIVPAADDVDVAWARIGDILAKTGKHKEARDVYNRTVFMFPEKEGGLIAQMRLAEEGILDQPSMEDMENTFEKQDLSPERIYQRISERKDSPLAPIAQLKLAMLYMWKKQYASSLESTELFQKDYPRHDLLPKAREVAEAALQDWILRDLEQNNHGGMIERWNRYGSMFDGKELPPQLRLAMATAYMKENDPRKALEMARPFVFGTLPKGTYSEPGLDLTLSMLLELREWAEIPELAKRVASWNLSPDRQRQVDYATALAHENLRQHPSAKPLWLKLATNMALTDTERGYAHYFLALGASAAGDLEQTSILAQEALSLLLKDKDDLPKIRDSLDLLVQTAEKSDRVQDALGWSLQYDEYLTSADAAWPAHTFRKALLYKKNSDMTKWRENLEAIRQLFPNSLHGRMASSELESMRLEKEAGKFR